MTAHGHGLPACCLICGAWIQRLVDNREFDGDGMRKHYQVVHPGRTVGDPQQPSDWSVRNG